MSTSGMHLKSEPINETSLVDEFKSKNVIVGDSTAAAEDSGKVNSVLSTRDNMSNLIDEMEALSKY